MKVLFVVDSDERRGAEMFASDLVRALDGRAFEQRVVLLHRSGQVSFEAPVQEVPSGWPLPGLRIDLRTLLWLRSVIRDWRPDIVQSAGGDAVKYAGLAAVGTRARVVHRWIGAPLDWIRGRSRTALYRWLFRRAAANVAVADLIREQLSTGLGVPSDSIHSFPNAVDAKRLEPGRDPPEVRRSLGVPSGSTILLSVGALSSEKDPMAHLAVSERVLSERPDTIHLIVGDGPMRREIDDHVRQQRLAGRVLVLGTRQDIGDLLAISDVVLVLSQTEGLPAIVIEAGLAGVPVAGYAVGAVSEVTIDGVTGILVPPGDEDALVARILRLLHDDQARRLMGERGRETCARFAMESVAPRYMALYEELLGMGKAS
jgi:glycosyltransferase involved in cell wall biosynthesis